MRHARPVDHEDLPQGETHVWLARPEDAGPAELARCLAGLSEDERARHDRFWFARDRTTFAVAHAMVREALAGYTGVPPTAWRFAAGTHGRPEIAHPTEPLGLRFNLSHTRGLVAVAVSREVDVGIDVEDTTRRSSTLRIARRYFAPAEVEALEHAPETEQRRLFFRFWTLKEAYLKACGLGLGVPLRDFGFELGPLGGSPRIWFAARRSDDPGAWQLEERTPTATHALAVAIRVAKGMPHAMRLRWQPPQAP
jgi:4'-phosphopantetheinyl transferase